MKSYGLDLQNSALNSVANGIHSGDTFPSSPLPGALWMLTSTFGAYEAGQYWYNGASWLSFGDITAVTAGNGLTGGGITGDLTLAIDTSKVMMLTDTRLADLSSISAISANGLIRRTGTGTWIGNTKVALASDVSGNLPVLNLNSGTGATATTFWRGDGTWGNQNITYTGDATGSGTTSIALTLANSGVTAGTYNNVTVNSKGLVATGTNSAYLLGNQTITFTGAATGSGATSVTLTLANSGVTAGTYNGFAVNAKGLITSVTLPTTLGGYGITDAQALSTELTSIAGISVTGLIRRNAAGSWAGAAKVALASEVSGNLPVANLNSGTGAAANTFWAGDGTWKLTPDQPVALTGDITGSGTTSMVTTLAITGVTAGTYNNVTVNAKGLATAGSNVAYLTANQNITVTGDATGSGNTAIALTLANSGVTAGVYDHVQVDAKGRVTAGLTWNSTIRQAFMGNINQQSGTTTITNTTTAPANTSGTLLVTQSITPSSTLSKIELEFSGLVDGTTAAVLLTVFRGSTFIGMTQAAVNTGALLSNVNTPVELSLKIYDVPGVTTATTYTIRIGANASGTWYLGRTAANTYGGTNPSGWSMREIV